MRWRFIDPNNHQEVRERNAMLTKIDDWWQAFLSDHIAIVRSFKRPTDFKLAEWMDRHLHAIHPDLMWEFAHAVEGPGHRLVITPESDHHLRPLVRAILERAPAIDKWEFYEYRLSEDLESTLSTVEARAKREAADFKVRISRGKHNRVDLKFSAPSISSTEDRAALDAAFVATETLLGEECLNHWIGVIEVSPIQRATVLSRVFGRVAPEQRHFVGLDRFHDTVISLGGTGLRYSYIDLALTDVDKAIAVIKRRLQAGNVPKRSWIQFFDSDLAAEWVGIYHDTPPPPLAFS